MPPFAIAVGGGIFDERCARSIIVAASGAAVTGDGSIDGAAGVAAAAVPVDVERSPQPSNRRRTATETTLIIAAPA
jgi:hypothetical protein